jgi:MinD-like ATPase involved in chromosome partitioning or flagellar assembly
LVTVIEALMQSYDYVVIDAGSATSGAVERLAAIAKHALLVTSDPMSAATRTAADRLRNAGFSDVAVLVGGAQAAAA